MAHKILNVFLGEDPVGTLEQDASGTTRFQYAQAWLDSPDATPLLGLVIPLPPLSEQRWIVAKVEQLMALVDALETQLAASRATAAQLLSALVAELTGTKSNGKAPKPAAPARPSRPPAQIELNY